jgi:hypothetical protein
MRELAAGRPDADPGRQTPVEPPAAPPPPDAGYTDEEEEEVRKRLEDLGYVE